MSHSQGDSPGDSSTLPSPMSSRVPGGESTGAAMLADHGEFLTRLAYRLTGDRDRAADLVQDVLVDVLRNHDRVLAASHQRAYLRRMLVNRHLNVTRRQRRWRSATRQSSAGSAAPTAPVEPAANDAYRVVDDRDLVWRALATLPARQRAALVLRYYEDLDDAGISDALGCRPGTTRSLISRGLASLRLAAPHAPDTHQGGAS